MVEYVRLGSTGVEVSEACLGTATLGRQSASGSEVVDENHAFSILDTAWDRGVNFIDTANVYGGGRSEEYVGKWLAGKDRENFVVASKVAYPTRGRQAMTLSRKGVRAEVEGSLSRLNIDYLDICYIHEWNYSTPIEETLAALDDLVRSGRIHYLGVSNFATWQLVLAYKICESKGWAPVSVIQPRFNAVDNVPYTCDPDEMPLPDLFDACRYLDIAVCPFSPLAEGFLTGKYSRDADGKTIMPAESRGARTEGYGEFPDRWWRVLETVESVAADVGATPAQVAISWVSNIAGVASIPIVGATSADQLNETLGYVEVTLSDKQHQRISDAGQISDLTPHVYSYT